MPIKIIAAGEQIAAPAPQAFPAPQAVPTQAVAAPPPSASETLIRSAVTAGIYRAPGGQTYAFRKLGPLDRMLLSKALGGELMLNGVYASYAFVAASITEINGEPQAMPSSTRQVEARVQRVSPDWDGLNEAMRAAFSADLPEDGDDGEA